MSPAAKARISVHIARLPISCSRTLRAGLRVHGGAYSVLVWSNLNQSHGGTGALPGQLLE